MTTADGCGIEPGHGRFELGFEALVPLSLERQIEVLGIAAGPVRDPAAAPRRWRRRCSMGSSEMRLSADSGVRGAGGLTSVSAMGSNPEDGQRMKLCRIQPSESLRQRPSAGSAGLLNSSLALWLILLALFDRKPAWRPRYSLTRCSDQLRRLQHADDFERDRAVRRPSAARRLPAAPDPLPASGSGSDRRLRGDVADPRRRCPSRAKRRQIYWVTTCGTWRESRPQDRGRLGPGRAARPGAQFGEVTATIHQKLGCVGHITSGCPRDLDEVRGLGFQLFGLNPCVSHAYVRLLDFGSPVNFPGTEIRTGDLIHADKHGVCLIPHEVASQAGGGLAEVERRERPLLEICRSDKFSLEEYIKLRSASHSKILE